MKYYKGKRNPPCDLDNICGVTGFDVNHDERFMNIPWLVNIISGFWLDIISISRREKYEKKQEKQTTIYHFYTVEKIDSYLDSLQWDLYPITRNEAYRLILKFHLTYISGMFDG